MAILETRGLVKFYRGRKVVDGVSFEVDVGEIVGLLGPNGAGKTTSFRMITGQVTPNGGTVLFNGHDVAQLPMFRRAASASAICRSNPASFASSPLNRIY